MAELPLRNKAHLFFWESTIDSLLEINDVVVVQFKDFSFREVAYKNENKEWFETNVQCWLKKLNDDKPLVGS